MLEDSSNMSKVFRIELYLLTYFWNEGFSIAQEPWLQIYTDNEDWVKGLPKEYYTPDRNGFEQDLRVQVDMLHPESEIPTQDELNLKHSELMDDEVVTNSSRYIALTRGLSGERLDRIVNFRLSEWEGI